MLRLRKDKKEEEEEEATLNRCIFSLTLFFFTCYSLQVKNGDRLAYMFFRQQELASHFANANCPTSFKMFPSVCLYLSVCFSLFRYFKDPSRCLSLSLSLSLSLFL